MRKLRCWLGLHRWRLYDFYVAGLVVKVRRCRDCMRWWIGPR